MESTPLNHSGGLPEQPSGTPEEGSASSPGQAGQPLEEPLGAGELLEMGEEGAELFDLDQAEGAAGLHWDDPAAADQEPGAGQPESGRDEGLRAIYEADYEDLNPELELLEEAPREAVDPREVSTAPQEAPLPSAAPEPLSPEADASSPPESAAPSTRSRRSALRWVAASFLLGGSLFAGWKLQQGSPTLTPDPPAQLRPTPRLALAEVVAPPALAPETASSPGVGEMRDGPPALFIGLASGSIARAARATLAQAAEGAPALEAGPASTTPADTASLPEQLARTASPPLAAEPESPAPVSSPAPSALAQALASVAPTPWRLADYSAVPVAVIWQADEVPIQLLDSPNQVLTPDVGSVRVSLGAGDAFEGSLYAVGQGSVWLDFGPGRIALDAERVESIQRLEGPADATTEEAAERMPGERVTLRLPGGRISGSIVARRGDRITLLTDAGARITLDDPVFEGAARTSTIRLPGLDPYPERGSAVE